MVSWPFNTARESVVVWSSHKKLSESNAQKKGERRRRVFSVPFFLIPYIVHTLNTLLFCI